MIKKWLLSDFRDIPLPILLFAMPVIVIFAAVVVSAAYLGGSALLPEQDKYLMYGLRELFGIAETTELSFSFSASIFTETPILWLLLISMPIWNLAIEFTNLYWNGKKFGKKKHAAIYVSHFLINVLLAVVAFVFLSCFVQIVYAITGEELLYKNVVVDISAAYAAFTANIPTLVELPRPLVFVVVVLAIDLPIYVFHRLIHESRFLWYICHRSHHTPEILNPIGAGPVFGFNFLFLRFPMFLFALVLSKLMYVEPVLFELTIYLYLRVLLEKLNHCSSFYQICRENRFIYFLSSIVGCGTFHYTHHSAVKGQEAINLANELFCFWDRVFGTYVTPPLKKPPIGLTDQPDIKLNPFVLLFSGWQTIIYELAHNPARDWHKILFGHVSYEPANTKDYLIIGPPQLG